MVSHPVMAPLFAQSPNSVTHMCRPVVVYSAATEMGINKLNEMGCYNLNWSLVCLIEPRFQI